MMNETKIKALEELGFRRWQKGNFDRLYINATALGLEFTRYNTGNIQTATFGGSRISNCEARRMLNSKTFIDVKDGTIHSDSLWLEEAVQELMASLPDEG